MRRNNRVDKRAYVRMCQLATVYDMHIYGRISLVRIRHFGVLFCGVMLRNPQCDLQGNATLLWEL